MIKQLLTVLALCPALSHGAGNLAYGPLGGKPQQLLEIADNTVRMSSQGQSQWVLYRDQGETLFLVDDAQRSYSQVTRETAAQLNARVAQMQKQVEAQLAMLPPAQREMMRGMMPKLPDFTAQHEFRLEKQDGTRKVGDWDCQPVLVYDNQQPSDQLCLAAVKSVGMAAEDFALIKRMSAVLGQFAAQFGGGSMAAVLEQLDGVPVAYRHLDSEQPESVLLRIGREAPAPERMQIPPDYREQSLMPGMAP